VTARQQVFIASGNGSYDEIEKRGLPLRQAGLGVFGEGRLNDTPLHLLLFDKKRETTGYHLAVLRTTYGGKALNELGLPWPYSGPEPVAVDIIAFAPREDWPVEKRQVSQMQIAWVMWTVDLGKPVELFIRINGELAHREVIVRGSPLAPVVEVTGLNIAAKIARLELPPKATK
jgi:hypothetical protein